MNSKAKLWRAVRAQEEILNILEKSFTKKGASNKNRKKVIEIAKVFVESYTNKDMVFYHKKNNEVIVELKSSHEKASAKCNSDDVFNIHIGQAIALGRLIGINVSIFTNAPQPKKIVVGHLLTFHKSFKWHKKIVYHVDNTKEVLNNLTIVVDTVDNTSFVGELANANTKNTSLVIYDDSIAQY